MKEIINPNNIVTQQNLPYLYASRNHAVIAEITGDWFALVQVGSSIMTWVSLDSFNRFTNNQYESPEEAINMVWMYGGKCYLMDNAREALEYVMREMC